MSNHQSKQLTGGVIAGLFTGILIGYFLGLSQSKSDEKFLSQWVKDCGDYEDGNVFGYETGLPDNYHEQGKESNKRDKKTRFYKSGSR